MQDIYLLQSIIVGVKHNNCLLIKIVVNSLNNITHPSELDLLSAVFKQLLKGTSGGPRHCISTPTCPLKLSCYLELDPTKNIHIVKHR